MKTKIFAIVTICLVLSSCGYSSKDNELKGQVKRTMHNTPLICADYDAVDISLGIMENGVGSMSTQDTWLNVPDKNDLALLKANTGKLVRITYDEKRASFCNNQNVVRKVELVK